MARPRRRPGFDAGPRPSPARARRPRSSPARGRRWPALVAGPRSSPSRAEARSSPPRARRRPGLVAGLRSLPARPRRQPGHQARSHRYFLLRPTARARRRQNAGPSKTPARARSRPSLVADPRPSPVRPRRRHALVAGPVSSLARPHRRPGFVPGLRLTPARPRRWPALFARAPSRHRSGLVAGPGSSPARARRWPALVAGSRTALRLRMLGARRWLLSVLTPLRPLHCQLTDVLSAAAQLAVRFFFGWTRRQRRTAGGGQIAHSRSAPVLVACPRSSPARARHQSSLRPHALVACPRSSPARARHRLTGPPFAGTRCGARRQPTLSTGRPHARSRRLQSSLARPRRRPGFVLCLRLTPARPHRRPALVARAPSRHRSGLVAGPGSSPARARRRPAHGTPVTHARSQALVTFSPNASAASPLPSHKTSSPQPRNLQRGFFRVDSTPAAVAKSLTLEARPCCT